MTQERNTAESIDILSLDSTSIVRNLSVALVKRLKPNITTLTDLFNENHPNSEDVMTDRGE
jgi:hypothetical protein